MEKKTDNIDILEEKEKKAIEEFKKLKDYKRTYYGYSWFTVEVCADDEMKQNIDIILNIIEKQSKEIEELKEDNKRVKFLYDDACKCLLNSVDKDKIKAKMKEKEWALENYDCDESDYKQSQAIGAWSVLQSLLEKE